MNIVRLSLAASALAFGGTLFAQMGSPAPSVAAPAQTQNAGPAAVVPPAPGVAPRGPHKRPDRDGRTRRYHSGFMPGVDANRDGQITLEELQAAQKRQLERFEQIDTNHDGVLTPDELRASHEALREQRRKQMAERRVARPATPAAPVAPTGQPPTNK